MKESGSPKILFESLDLIPIHLILWTGLHGEGPGRPVDMERGGLRNVTGVNFTDASKEAMATALKEQIRRVICPQCSWEGYVDALEGEWRTTCPKGCRSEEGNPIKLRPLLHLPYDQDLIRELNAERFELGKTGKLLFNHPEGTHDDRFWAVALAVYTAEQAPPPPSKPMARTIGI